MSLVKPIGDAKLLEKRVPKSAKYKSVKSKLDTGNTIDKEIQRIGEHSINARFKRVENFQRIKSQQLVQKIAEMPEDILLLDLREMEQFERCYIASAIHYPHTMITRSVNPFIPQILEFKNKPSKQIVIYDLGEELACGAGELFFEKGFDNVFVLTGGLKHFAKHNSKLVKGEMGAISPVKMQQNQAGISDSKSVISIPYSVASSARSASSTRTESSTRSASLSTKTAISNGGLSKKWKP